MDDIWEKSKYGSEMPKNPIDIFEYCEYLVHMLKGETFIF